MVNVLEGWLLLQEEGQLPIADPVMPLVRTNQQDDYFVVRPTLRKRESSQQLMRGPSPSPATPYTGWNVPTGKTSGFAQYLPISLSMKSSNQSQFSQILTRDRQGSEISIFPTDMEGEDRVPTIPTAASLRRSTKSPNRSASPRDRHNFRAQIFSKTIESVPDTSLGSASKASAPTESAMGGVGMTKQGSRVTFGSPVSTAPDNRFGRHGSLTALPRNGRPEKKVTWQIRPSRGRTPVQCVLCVRWLSSA
jgi:hypothetical protein